MRMGQRLQGGQTEADARYEALRIEVNGPTKRQQRSPRRPSAPNRSQPAETDRERRGAQLNLLGCAAHRPEGESVLDGGISRPQRLMRRISQRSKESGCSSEK